MLYGASVEPQLDKVYKRLEAGEIFVEDLTEALAAFVSFGYAIGRASRQDEIDFRQSRIIRLEAELARVNAEADRIASLAYNAGVTR